MDRFKQLQIVVAIYDEGSLAAAATRVGLSLTMVSRYLSALEDEMGGVLFERNARRCRATDAGLAVVERARQLLIDHDALIEAASDQWRLPQGRIRMTAPLTFGRLHVLPAVCTFLNEQSEINVGLELSDAIIDLQAEDFDLAVRLGPLHSASLIAKRVGFVGSWALASPSYLARHGRPQHPQDLKAHRWIRHSSVRQPGPMWLGGQAPEVDDIRLSVNDAASALEAAKGGLGITTALSYQAMEAVAEGRLVRVLTAFEPEPTPVWLVFPEARKSVRRVRLLVDFLATEIAAACRRAEEAADR